MPRSSGDKHTLDDVSGNPLSPTLLDPPSPSFPVDTHTEIGGTSDCVLDVSMRRPTRQARRLAWWVGRNV